MGLFTCKLSTYYSSKFFYKKQCYFQIPNYSVNIALIIRWNNFETKKPHVRIGPGKQRCVGIKKKLKEKEKNLKKKKRAFE